MDIKCPACGAHLSDGSRFCNYCGVKIDDGIKRSEIRIEQRNEDVAEVIRAQYEKKESEIRIQNAISEKQKRKTKRYTLIIMLVISSIIGGIGFANPIDAEGHPGGIPGTFVIIAIGTIIGIVYQLLTGKW